MGFFGFLYRQITFKPQPLPQSIQLTGQTAIVTGANIGLGFEASRELIQHGVSRLIMGVRSVSKGEAAKHELESITGPKCTVEIWELDLDNFASIVEFGKRARALDRLDLALLNAGVKQVEYIASSSGHESCVQVNHLGTALLSIQLLQPLRMTAKQLGKPSRMTFASTEMHMWAAFPERTSPNILARMDEKDSFGFPERYSASKLLNVFWDCELSTRVSASDIVITFANPGLCASSLHRTDDGAGMRVFTKLFAWSSAQGGHCLTNALVNQPARFHGGYFSEQKPVPYSSLVLSPEGQKLQKKLWVETIDLLKREAPNAEFENF